MNQTPYTKTEKVAGELFLSLFDLTLMLPHQPGWYYNEEGQLIVEGGCETLQSPGVQPDDSEELYCSVEYIVDPDLTYLKKYYDELGELIEVDGGNLVDWEKEVDLQVRVLEALLERVSEDFMGVSN